MGEDRAGVLFAVLGAWLAFSVVVAGAVAVICRGGVLEDELRAECVARHRRSHRNRRVPMRGL